MNAEQEIVSALAAIGLRDRPACHGVENRTPGISGRNHQHVEDGQASYLGWPAVEAALPSGLPRVWPDRPGLSWSSSRTAKTAAAVAKGVAIAIAALLVGSGVGAAIQGASHRTPVVVQMLWHL